MDILFLARKAHHHKISHSLDPHSGARTVVRLRAPSVRFSPSGQTKSPSVFTLGSFVCCPLGGNRSLLWIFYFWLAKLTIIKYLTRSTPTRALGLSSGFARPRFDSPRADKQNRPVYSHWAHLFVVRSGGIEPSTISLKGSCSTD